MRILFIVMILITSALVGSAWAAGVVIGLAGAPPVGRAPPRGDGPRRSHALSRAWDQRQGVHDHDTKGSDGRLCDLKSGETLNGDRGAK
jgi:hypothetical protein